MRKIILTGSMGYIGSKIQRRLLRQNFDIFDIDIKAGKNIKDYLHPSGKMYKYAKRFGADAIIHTAATPRIDYSIKNPLETFENNALMSSIVMNFARENNIKDVVISSSSSAIDPTLSPYAFQKKTIENEALMYNITYKMRIKCLRYYNVYSKFLDYQEHKTLIGIWLKNIKDGEPLTIYGSGDQRRDMVHIDDVVSANINIAIGNTICKDHVVHVGTGKNISVNEVFDIFKRNFNCKLERRPARRGEVSESISESSFFGNIDIRFGINSVIEDFKERFYENKDIHKKPEEFYQERVYRQ